MIKKLTVFVVILILTSLAFANNQYIHHNLKVTLNPDDHFIRVKDTIHLPADIIKKKIHFLLHGNLTIVSKPEGIQIKKEIGEQGE